MKHVRREMIHVVPARSGALTLKLSSPDGGSRAIHSLYDPEAEAEALVNASRFDEEGILVVLGLGLGYHLKKLIEKYPDACIVVVEALEEIYEIAKSEKGVDLLREGIEFIVAASPREVLERITKIQLERGMPPIGVFNLSSATGAFPEYYRPIAARLTAAASFRLWERLRYRKFKTPVLKVAVMDFDYFLTLEIERALRGLGHRVYRIKGDLKREKAADILTKVVKAVLDIKPDFLIAVNHIAFDEEGVVSSFLHSIEMPVAVWYVDSPTIIVKAFKGNATPNTAVFVWDRTYIEDLRAMGFESVHYLPLATDETVFFPRDVTREEMETYGAETGFIGNSMVRSTEEYMERLPLPLRPLVEKLARPMSEGRQRFNDALRTLDERELEMLDSSPEKTRSDFETALLRKATFLYRLSCIGYLSSFNTVIHGDRGWRKILNGNYIIRPRLNYYTELPVFYNACRINFNATSLQMREAVNQRVFDVPACGAFLLTDHQGAIEELFEVGEEVITYRERGEIPELVRFYLRNRGQREAVAGRGRERVLGEHTYRRRIERMIQVMRKIYR